MEKGFITLQDGMVVRIEAEGQDPAELGPAVLHDFLKKLKTEGWEPDGELPPYTASGTYKIALRRAVEKPIGEEPEKEAPWR